ncbi:23S rRNA (pseudouridine(1915)-N(3))-methyltransferase RlmH [bacterium]|nr:23S rRNA (pseudouridine(1915)-N(3))-methyltransferase RlmH [bacterium]
MKPFKSDNREFVIKKETEKLIARLHEKYHHLQKILLIKEGKSLSTEQLAQLVNRQDSVFIIGGPYGVDRQLFLSAFPELQEVSF